MSIVAVNSITDASGGNTASINGYSPTESNMAGRNAIINGNFDIWQRGTSFAAAGYGADRWIHNVAGASGTVTQSRQAFTVGQTDVPNEPTYFYRIQGSSYTMTAGNVSQKIEDVRTFAGQTITVSFYAKASASRELGLRFHQAFDGSANVDTYASPVSLTTSWQKFIATVSIPSIAGKTIGANSRLELTFDIKEGGFGSNLNSDSIDIAQVQVEAGSVATPFERRTVGTELALCQRYYQLINYGEASGVFWGSTSAYLSRDLPTVMRITPSLTFPASLVNAIDQVGVAGRTPTNLAGLRYTSSVIAFYGLGMSGATVGYPAQWIGDPINVDAEL